MANFKLTPNAREDLKNIANIAKHTVKKWGKEQALIYKNKLDAFFKEISQEQFVQRAFALDLPGLFVRRCEKHFVFYLKKEKEPAVILNILHSRMDLMERISKRLREYDQ